MNIDKLIEKLRDELNSLINKHDTFSPITISKSQELDLLIVEKQRIIMKEVV